MEMQSPSYKDLPHRPEYATAGLDLAMCGNFDIIFGDISQLQNAPHTPHAMFFI